MITKVSKGYKTITVLQVLGLVSMFILEKMTFGRGGLVHHLLFRKRQFLKLIPLTYLRLIGLALIVLALVLAFGKKAKEVKKYPRIESILVFSLIGLALSLNLQAPLRSYAYLTVALLVVAVLQGLKYYSEGKKI